MGREQQGDSMGYLEHVDIHSEALRVLRSASNPSVRVCLLRDVLGVPSDDRRLAEAREALPESIHVDRLMQEQRPDGGWGRLHSRDRSIRCAVPTTEWGVERAVALGLDASSNSLSRAADYLARVIDGRLTPSDRPEKNDR